ncbi:MAG: hypothetical protein M0R37_12825 [Bacteroidales bacterium]|nr:hypothetical protein [Bacteroidales bacterium]
MGYDKLIVNIDYIQEGNKDDFTFDLDTNFPVEEVGDITFQVRDSLGKEVFSKKKSTGGITLAERVVSVLFAPADTTGKAGTHYYELDFKDAGGSPFATIGGKFTINKEVNTL